MQHEKTIRRRKYNKCVCNNTTLPCIHCQLCIHFLGNLKRAAKCALKRQRRPSTRTACEWLNSIWLNRRSRKSTECRPATRPTLPDGTPNISAQVSEKLYLFRELPPSVLILILSYRTCNSLCNVVIRSVRVFYFCTPDVKWLRLGEKMIVAIDRYYYSS